MSDETSVEADVVNPYQQPEAVEAATRGEKPLFPPAWVWVVVALCGLLIAWVRFRTIGGDRATVNVFTLILGFLACNAIGLWFLLFSGYTWRFRLGSLIGLFSCIVLFFVVFRIDHVSGELVPSFRSRFSPHPDELLEDVSGTTVAGGVDLAKTSGDDFSQFLGPRGNASLDDLEIEIDWQTHPPQVLWRQPIGAGWSGFAAVNGYAVTMEQRGEEELVTCYEVETGKLVWAHAEQTRHATLMGGIGPRSTPTIQDGKVYTLGATGILLCLDGSTGDVVWRDDLFQRYGVAREDALKAVAWGRSNSPLIVDELVVVPAGGPKNGKHVSLAAFDRTSGELVWQAGDRQVSYASPVLATMAGRRQIISVNEDNVTGHDPSDGQILWEFSWPGNSTMNASVSQPVVLPGDRILLTKAYSVGAAVFQLSEAPGGSFETKLLWENHAVLKTKFTNVSVRDGFAYGLSDGILECVDLSNGRRRWKRGRYGQGQVLGIGGTLLVQAESGDVVVVERSPQKFVELARLHAIRGKTWNNPCLFGDRLLVRNGEEAACYRLRITRR